MRNLPCRSYTVIHNVVLLITLQHEITFTLWIFEVWIKSWISPKWCIIKQALFIIAGKNTLYKYIITVWTYHSHHIIYTISALHQQKVLYTSDFVFPQVTSRWYTVNISYLFMAISLPVEILVDFWDLKSLEMAQSSEEKTGRVGTLLGSPPVSCLVSKCIFDYPNLFVSWVTFLKVE